MQGLADGIPSGCYGLVSMFGQRTSQMEGLSGFQTRVEWMTVGSRIEVKNRQNKGVVLLFRERAMQVSVSECEWGGQR